ncbi:hypothetical protein FE257_009015 [Aspergillus nanangensis]|uniref:Bacteriophage T5 Orf172 DNA-binding domain-containing protein n=1 Tax=Aspergillus nanangensis TaxID=2582783 RepID=A0AAD4GZV1_ASPNN|nr:hypothetical protein FE257_009015 [Aspergillus nanangensis]
MPHITSTPESIMSRADSLNPSTTCRGITANGRPCRRALASSTTPTPSGTPMKHGRVGAVNPAAAYCWQHKDQADIAPRPIKPQNTFQMKTRTSIDTLMDRLGVLDINEKHSNSKKRRDSKKPNTAPKKQTRKTICCCFDVIIEDVATPSRPARPTHNPPQHSPPMQQMPNGLSTGQTRPQKPSSKPSSQAGLLSPNQTPSRPSLQSTPNSSSSQTKSLLSWIPTTLTPQTTSILLTELAKPISPADEPGYIYMFWVTPSTSSRSMPPPLDVASSLIPNALSPEPTRGISDALQTARDLNALTSSPTSSSPGALRLKIGRTSNVQRRMNEWTRQCSHDVTLIRYYPYVRNRQDPRGTSIVPGQKVPHVHRVERLVHLELGDMRLRDLGQCEDCGKEHREWFEVPAEKMALKRVDDCIRRWVEWAERQ